MSRGAIPDADARGIVVRSLQDLADDHARLGELAFRRGDETVGCSYIEIAAALRQAALVLDVRRGLLELYENAIEQATAHATDNALRFQLVKGGKA